MVQKTFFASKGTNYYPKSPKHPPDFSTNYKETEVSRRFAERKSRAEFAILRIDAIFVKALNLKIMHMKTTPNKVGGGTPST